MFHPTRSREHDELLDDIPTLGVICDDLGTDARGRVSDGLARLAIEDESHPDAMLTDVAVQGHGTQAWRDVRQQRSLCAQL
ncbi:MAG: hypothetical protein U0797_24385 [Gemmataceae bacterium]